MSSHKKRTERRRGQPDPVAQRISSDLEARGASREDGVDHGESGAPGGRFTVGDTQVDLSAGEEFVQQQARPSRDGDEDKP